MQYKLLKTGGYWIIVSDEQPYEGDLCFNKHALNHSKYDVIGKCSKNAEINWKNNMSYNNGKTFLRDNYFKLIASENPEHNLPSITFSDEIAKELGVNVEEFIKDEFGFDDEMLKQWEKSLSGNKYADYGNILNLTEKALFNNKDKLFTLEQAEEIFREGYNLCLSKHFKLLDGKIHPDEVPFDSEPMDFNETIQSITKQEYDCELEMEEYSDYDFTGMPCVGFQRPKITNNSVKVIKLL